MKMIGQFKVGDRVRSIRQYGTKYPPLEGTVLEVHTGTGVPCLSIKWDGDPFETKGHTNLFEKVV